MFLSTPRVLGALFSAVALCNALPQPESHAFQIGSGLHKRSALSEQYTSYAIAAINQMMTYYDATTGLFDGAWWNSANVITMLADYENAFPGVNKAFTHTIETTFAKAVSPFSPRGSFLNTFYDDELWWALAWIKVYDVTGNTTYLDKAAEIWKDPRSVWNATVCNNIKGVHGGIWWDFAHTSVNAIANELFLTTSIKLANRIPSDGEYFTVALQQYKWFIASGMINGNNIINDGLNIAVSPCANNGAEGWTYNQGAILSGLAEMTWATGDTVYNTLANTLAKASMAHYANNTDHILHETCEPSGCSSDLQQFKGIYGRNIQFLVNRATVLSEELRSNFTTFLQNNANVIWADDRGVDNQLGLVWSGPSGIATVQTQSSALDAIVGAAAVS